MNITLYGLQNCDATITAKRSLEKAGAKFTFCDIRKSNPGETKLKDWVRKLGWEKVLNKRSTTWKELPEGIKNIPLNEESALRLIIEHVTLIKRPVLELDENLFIGKEALENNF